MGDWGLAVPGFDEGTSPQPSTNVTMGETSVVLGETPVISDATTSEIQIVDQEKVSRHNHDGVNSERIKYSDILINPGDVRDIQSFTAGEAIAIGEPVNVRTNEISKTTSSHDARVLESSPNTNYETGTTAVMGSTNATDTGDSYFFIKWDVSSVAITTADKAFLRLQVTSISNSVDINNDFYVRVYQVTSADWDESTLTWNNQPTFDSTQETTLEFEPNCRWTDDFLETSAGLKYIFLDITTLYNEWKAGTSSNYGVCVRFVKRFTGSEDATATINITVATSENATSAIRPTLFVTGVSDNVGKAYKANASDFTDIYGQLGIAMIAAASGDQVSVQFTGVVENQSGLTAGKTYYVNDSEVLSTTPGTLVREIGTALSSTRLDLNKNFVRILSDVILYEQGGNFTHDTDTTFFLPIGFKPKIIRFDGTAIYNAGTERAVNGVWVNGNQLTNTNDTMTTGYLVYYTSAITLSVTNVFDTGITFLLEASGGTGANEIEGILIFEL